MNRTIEKRIEVLRKKLNCPLENCGEQFVFEITEHAMEIAKHNERHRYQGKCKRCGKILRLTSNGISALSIGFGEAEFKVVDTMFENLFDEFNQKTTD